MNLRLGELVVKCAGGKCAVCKNVIEPGDAVQLSSYTNRIRHLNCTPKTDSRGKRIGRKRQKRKFLGE